MSTKLRKRATIAGAAFIVLYSGWQAWLWWLRNEPLDRAATNVVQALIDGNTDILWNYSFSGDRDGHGIDRQQFDRLLTTYVAPAVRGLVRGRATGLWTSEHQVYEHTEIFLRDGREVAFDFVLFRTPDGPRGYLVSPCIVVAMTEKYGEKHAMVAGNKRLWRTLFDGIAADRAQLESIGIRGYLDGAPGNTMSSWARMLRTYDRYRN